MITHIFEGILSYDTQKFCFISLNYVRQSGKHNRYRSPVLYFPSLKPRSGFCNFFIRDKSKFFPFVLSNGDGKKLPLFSLQGFYSFPSRLPHLIDRDQHLGRQGAGKQLGAPSSHTWQAPGCTQARTAVFAQHLSQAGRHKGLTAPLHKQRLCQS